MAGSLLDIYGNYQQAVDRYNNAGQAWNNAVEAYNQSIISDPSFYQGVNNRWGGYTIQPGNYSGSGPYTMYNGYTVGRTGTPIKQYQTKPVGYNTVTDSNNITGYDQEGNPIYATSKVPFYGGTNENTYVNPTTGLASVFASRPTDSFDMAAPIAPPPMEVSSVAGNVDPSQLYQTLYGKATPDLMSNEAWALQNISTPFLSSETSAYDTGGVNRMNNPLYYAGPDSLTTGQNARDINSYISGQQTGNLYY